MPAILFGSIGTVADTSEIQRQAFNQAFKAHGLDWHWHREDYLAMLEKSGGQNRIVNYADFMKQTVDVDAIHRSKSKIFQSSLATSQIEPRLGVVETIQSAKSQGFKIAFVTTTTQENISLLLEALAPSIQATDFDLILSADRVVRPKPDKAAYTFTLEQLNERAVDCIAIEDNLDGFKAARSAGLSCIAFPNQNTAHHDFEGATCLVNRLDSDEIIKFVTGNLAQNIR